MHIEIDERIITISIKSLYGAYFKKGSNDIG
jgi:hypothetical protein